tara:strand:+ start:654 stop:911 length:258 start_codon:yes stop_codon:yes gene_type:complete
VGCNAVGRFVTWESAFSTTKKGMDIIMDNKMNQTDSCDYSSNKSNNYSPPNLNFFKEDYANGKLFFSKPHLYNSGSIFPTYVGDM